MNVALEINYARWMVKRQLPEQTQQARWKEFIQKGFTECRNDLACIRVDALRVKRKEVPQIMLREES
jgi:hypothetical protein